MYFTKMAGFENAVQQPPPAIARRSNPARSQSKMDSPEADLKTLQEKGVLVGVLRLVPVSWIPYAQLIRLHKPIGFAIVYLPYVIGILYAAAVSPSTLRVSVLLDRAWIFCIGSILLRSAGCTWDDIVDVDLDRQVERCATRPLVRGAVSLTQALIFLFGLTTLGIGVLTLLPWTCTVDAGIIVLLSSIYPYMKRFNHYAQVVLGLTIGFAIVMTMHALDVDPLAEYCRTSTICLWFSIAILMMLYDIVYAAQDTKDDVKAGVRGMAVRFRSSIRALISAMASAIIGLLVVCGLCSRLGVRYYIITVGGTGGSLVTMISAMDLAVPESCHKYCGGAYMLTCISMLIGFGTEYLHRA
jgi:4-hydroxybenzoate polyprenyltransferase